MFEYDEEKSRANEKKHGIKFSTAQELWDDAQLVQIPARTAGEPRFLIIGQLQGHYWSAIITYREERIRIISVRRSRKEEIELYEKF